MMSMDTFKVQLVKSLNGQKPSILKTAKSLGFRKMNQVIELKKNAPVMGAVRKIAFMIKVIG
jgi:large subunit ribosomal protein L30